MIISDTILKFKELGAEVIYSTRELQPIILNCTERLGKRILPIRTFHGLHECREKNSIYFHDLNLEDFPRVECLHSMYLIGLVKHSESASVPEMLEMLGGSHYRIVSTQEYDLNGYRFVIIAEKEKKAENKHQNLKLFNLYKYFESYYDRYLAVSNSLNDMTQKYNRLSAMTEAQAGRENDCHTNQTKLVGKSSCDVVPVEDVDLVYRRAIQINLQIQSKYDELVKTVDLHKKLAIAESEKLRILKNSRRMRYSQWLANLVNSPRSTLLRMRRRHISVALGELYLILKKKITLKHKGKPYHEKIDFTSKLPPKNIDKSRQQPPKEKETPIGIKISEELRLKLHRFCADDNPIILIFAKINPNIVDGSSIWLSSLVRCASQRVNTILLLDNDLQNKLVISDELLEQSGLLVVSPSELSNSDVLGIERATEAIQQIDCLVGRLQCVVVRGFEIVSYLVKDSFLRGRIVPYLTDFYKIDNNGRYCLKEYYRNFEQIVNSSKMTMWQTRQMFRYAASNFYVPSAKVMYWPPLLPRDIRRTTPAHGRDIQNSIVIGYAGKIQPDWGVLELIETTKRMISEGFNIRLKIISSKISPRNSIKKPTDFVHKVKLALTEPFVEYIQNRSRDEALRELAKSDIVWCYRPARLEEHTLELSTKLLEAVALGLPAVCYPNEINKGLLGDKYPFFISQPEQVVNLLQRKRLALDPCISDRIATLHSQPWAEEKIKGLLATPRKTTILFASHDYKFINQYYSNLKARGYKVIKDNFEWGTPINETRSRSLYEEADVIFCEWGLANAIWYSENNPERKPLFVRIHLQEINPRAARLSRQIQSESVTRFIFVSENVRQKAIQLFGWPLEKTIVVPNFTLEDDFDANCFAQKDTINLGIVGITPQRKRFDRAVELVERLLPKYPNAKLYVKGYRPEEYSWMHAPGRVEELEYYYEVYEKINRNPALKKSVVFDGFSNDMVSWYRKIDFILSPSDFESFHYAVADGVLSGCIPVVWDWDEAAQIYTEDWVVNSIPNAISRIEKHRKLSNHELISIKTENRKLVCDRYGMKRVFAMLDQELSIY